jgi:hypothetical protein
MDSVITTQLPHPFFNNGFITISTPDPDDVESCDGDSGTDVESCDGDSGTDVESCDGDSGTDVESCDGVMSCDDDSDDGVKSCDDDSIAIKNPETVPPYSLFTHGYVAIPAPSPAPAPAPAPAPSPDPAPAPAEASAHSALVLMFCSAGVVPRIDYEELAQKLIGESVPKESVLRRCRREDPDFFWELLSSIGMKPGQRSCLARYLDRNHAGATQVSTDAETVALSNLMSLFASAEVIPTTDYETIAQRLINLGVADETSLHESLRCNPPAFDLFSVMYPGQVYTIMEYLERCDTPDE